MTRELEHSTVWPLWGLPPDSSPVPPVPVWILRNVPPPRPDGAKHNFFQPDVPVTMALWYRVFRLIWDNWPSFPLIVITITISFSLFVRWKTTRRPPVAIVVFGSATVCCCFLPVVSTHSDWDGTWWQHTLWPVPAKSLGGQCLLYFKPLASLRTESTTMRRIKCANPHYSKMHQLDKGLSLIWSHKQDQQHSQ